MDKNFPYCAIFLYQLELKEMQEKNKEFYKYNYEHKYDDYIWVDDLGYRRNLETISAHFRLKLEKTI